MSRIWEAYVWLSSGSTMWFAASSGCKNDFSLLYAMCPVQMMMMETIPPSPGRYAHAHHFIIHWMQVQKFGRWFSQHSPWSLFRCVCHVQVDVMQFTCNPRGWRVDSADNFPIFLDVVDVISGLPAVRKVDVHFSGRYYKSPWLQLLMDQNKEEASHVRAIEEFCSG